MKTSLFRKLSSNRASAEMQQIANAGMLSASRSLQSLKEPVVPSPLKSPPSGRLHSPSPLPESPISSPGESCESSAPCSPAGPSSSNSSSSARPPSPLALPLGHQPGSSNATQTFSPGTSLSSL